MYRIKYIFVILALILFVAGCSNNSEDVSVSETLLSTIKLLPETRNLGTGAEKEAALFLRNKLEKYGYNVEMQKINYILSDNGFAVETGEKFPVNLKRSSYGTTNNIIAKSIKYNNSKNDIFIVAHYDTTEFPGVNDNASGVSVLLELAKNISNTKNFNVIYVLFSGEENLLLGSKYFVKNLTEAERSNIIAVINLDTLSGNSKPEISFAGQEYNSAYYLFEEVFAHRLNINLNQTYSNGDEISFYDCEIPSFSIGQEGENLHTEKDVIENLDMNDLELVYNVLHDALQEI